MPSTAPQLQSVFPATRPSTLSSGFTRSGFKGRTIAIVIATVAVAVAAHIAIPLPFTPVPLTLQPLAVLGVGLALGPAAGFAAMVAYLLEGVAGLPVFSPTGPGGVAQLLGPTGGFLLAYPAVAAISGGFTHAFRRFANPFLAATLACALAVVVLFLCGAGWLMLTAHLSLRDAWVLSIAPFLPGEAVKIVAAAGIYRTLSQGERH